MWQPVGNVWNSTDSSLPDGMHKHETGAYFKTPSIQSGTSSQSGVTDPPIATIATGSELLLVEENSSNSELSGFGGVPPPTTGSKRTPSAANSATSAGSTTTGRRQRLKEVKLLQSSQTGKLEAAAANMAPGQQSGSTSGAHAGFRSRLSSISGALQHPKLAKRLFHHNSGAGQDQMSQQRAPIQITTTSIDSPQHSAKSGTSGGNLECSAAAAAAAAAEAFEHEQRLMSSASGRRLSQLFLPQSATNPHMLSQDPYGANNELIPPHLLGLYGQPPLVAGSISPGGSGSGGPLGHRASWADASLFGRLTNVRPSIDSAFHSSGGQMRHSFDARK